MALFSTKSIYGLSAVAELIDATEQSPMNIKEIAKKTEISQNYIEQLFNMLKNSGIIKSLRGSKGGYFLAREAENISIKEILIALDGEIETTNQDIKNSDLLLYFYRKDEKLNELFDEPLSELFSIREAINYVI